MCTPIKYTFGPVFFITLQLSTLWIYINTVQLNTVLLILDSSLFNKDGSKD